MSKSKISNKTFIIISAIICIIIAALFSHFASSSPDGLEKVAEKLSFEQRAGEAIVKSAMPDYVVPQIQNEKVSASTAGAVGTIITFVLAFGAAFFLRKKK